MRNILIILVLICIKITICNGKRPCNITTFNGKYYEKKIIVKGHSWVSKLKYQTSTNYLVYTCVAVHPNWPPVQARYIDLKTEKDYTIPGSINMVSIAKHKNETIYFGGQNHYGIMRFDENSKNATFAIPARNFVDVFTFGKNLYISWIQFKEVHFYNEQESTWEIVDAYKDLKIDEFLEKDNGDVYYVSNDYCYKIKNGSNETLKLRKSKLDVRQIIEDQNGLVYFVGEGGVFVDDSNELKNVANIPGIQGLAFNNKNEIYFAIERAIGKLIPTDKKCT